jgi:hypothetical protein
VPFLDVLPWHHGVVAGVDDKAPEDVLSYRVYGPTRLVALATAIAFLVAALALLVFDRSKPWGNRLGASAFLVPGAIWLLASAVRSGVDISAHRVAVRTLSGRLIVFPTDDLDQASAGLTLALHRRSGVPVVVRAVSNTTITAFTHREGRAGRVANEINAFLGRRVSQ